MERVQEFIRYLTADDLLDVRFRLQGNRVVGFRINYRAFLHGAWREVIRYDNAHGQPLHVHRFWGPHGGAKEFLEGEVGPDYTAAFERAYQDLVQNWQDFRAKAEEDADEAA